ncbi:MAG: hypothetical protein R3E96_02910 [Planctomycetota bacterium]
MTLQNDITLPAISKSSGLTSANDGWNIAFVQEDLGGNDNSIRVITLDYDGTVLYPHWAVDQSPTVSWFSLDVSEANFPRPTPPPAGFTSWWPMTSARSTTT